MKKKSRLPNQHANYRWLISLGPKRLPHSTRGFSLANEQKEKFN